MKLKHVVLALFSLPPLLSSLHGEAATKGQAVFRSNCAFCHGATGEGGRGPNLASGRPTHGITDDDIRGIVKNGVPGTTMPSFQLEKSELDAVVGWVQHLRAGNTGKNSEAVTGDPKHGRTLFQQNHCLACHKVGGEGSVYGPELTRIGASRSLAYLKASLVDPSADIAPGYDGVVVTLASGKTVTGVAVNEDSFSVQLRNFQQQFESFDKAQVKQVAPAGKSLMPAYAKLPASDLNDLLAYLDSLRGTASVNGKAGEAKGIH